jgi:omega-amidase
MGELGMMICYDLRFPELCRILAASGACIILVSAQWPSRRIHHWNALLRARAIENQVFVVASNRCGRENDLEFPGHSQVISPLGDVLCFLDGNDGDVSEGFVAIDLNEITASRELFNTIRERRLTLEAPAFPGQEQEA